MQTCLMQPGPLTEKRLPTTLWVLLLHIFEQSIFISDVPKGTRTPLLGAEGGNDPAWSPDGEE